MEMISLVGKKVWFWVYYLKLTNSFTIFVLLQ